MVAPLGMVTLRKRSPMYWAALLALILEPPRETVPAASCPSSVDAAVDAEKVAITVKYAGRLLTAVPQVCHFRVTLFLGAVVGSTAASTGRSTAGMTYLR